MKLPLVPSIPGFKSDGCSNSPDTIFGYDIRWACVIHDKRYCTRLWLAGSLTQEWRKAADRELRLNIKASLPFGLKWVGFLYWRAVHRFGGDSSFDSCGTGNGSLCRHCIKKPAWML